MDAITSALAKDAPMTTLDEAREALLRNGNPPGMVTAFEAAVRAESVATMALMNDNHARTVGLLAESAETLAALREAARAVVSADVRAQSDDDGEAEEGEYAMSDALDALRAALDATPEDEERLNPHRDDDLGSAEAGLIDDVLYDPNLHGEVW